MCMTSRKATLSNTRIYVGEAKLDDKQVHVMAYQNAAESDGDEPNSMLLPIPSTEPMGEANLLDTREFKGFLEDISNATKIPTLSANSDGFFDKGTRSDKSFRVAKVFDVGSYTIVLAQDTDSIIPALGRVEEAKRPEITPDLLEGLRKLYPNHQWLLCCWNGSITPEPILCWYVPSKPEQLFIPTFDAHDGGAPKAGEVVQTDHIISIGSTTGESWSPVKYRQPLSERAAQILPKTCWGAKMPKLMKNGDSVVETKFSQQKKEIPLLMREGNFVKLAGWY